LASSLLRAVFLFAVAQITVVSRDVV